MSFKNFLLLIIIIAVNVVLLFKVSTYVMGMLGYEPKGEAKDVSGLLTLGDSGVETVPAAPDSTGQTANQVPGTAQTTNPTASPTPTSGTTPSPSAAATSPSQQPAAHNEPLSDP